MVQHDRLPDETVREPANPKGGVRGVPEGLDRFIAHSPFRLCGLANATVQLNLYRFYDAGVARS